MTIRVPCRLERQPRGFPADALYVPSGNASELLALCALLNLDPCGRVFALDEGFLLLLETPAAAAVPGAVRLRKLTEGLYLPADAALVPALLADEAAGVVRDRGLLFLHSGRVLEFDRAAAIDPRELLEAVKVSRGLWCSLPEPEAPAERLNQIVLEVPEQGPDEIYRQIRKEMNRGNSRPGSSRQDETDSRTLADELREPRDAEEAGSSTGDPAQSGSPGGELGRGGSKGLKDSAMHGIIRPLGDAITAMREKIQWEWVDHSRLIKKLVREFREGDKELALERAVPIMRPGDGFAPNVPVRANWLPWRRAVYNLADLLRRPGRGEVIPVRMARDEVIRELMEEYRKAAQEALNHGDFRRAAYIYGILLQDDRMAASALERAGLYHDAAIIYANKLNDRAAAAQAFEAAGEFDRALDLFRQLARHERAGDLLRRIGEEEAAIAEYLLAARELASASANHHGAGRLLLEKARRPELAIEQFKSGWQRRPAGNSTQCGLELARLHASSGAIEPFRQVLDEADAMFETPGYPFDGYFYNEIVKMADDPALDSISLEVRDRALQATARSFSRGIDHRRTSSTMVSKLLGRSKLWPAALVSDADFAVAAALGRRGLESIVQRDAPSGHSLQVGRGSVTAACQATVSGEIFLGFENGLVCVFQPDRELVIEVPSCPGTVVAISADAEGKQLAALCESHRGLKLCCFWKRPDGTYRSRSEIAMEGDERGWLTPILSMGMQRLVGVGRGRTLVVVDAASGSVIRQLTIAHQESEPPVAAVLFAASRGSKSSGGTVTVLTHDKRRWMVLDPSDGQLRETGCSWLPAETGAHALRSVPLSCRYAPPLLELVGVDRSGGVHAAEFHVDERSVELLASRVTGTDGGYVGAVHSGTNTVVAVSRSGIDWLSFHGDRFRLSHKEECSLPSAVACFATPSRDALVVCSRGLLIRVPPPRRGARGRN